MSDSDFEKPTDSHSRGHIVFLWSAGVLSFAVVCGLAGAYVATFSGGLDAEHTTWALFGDYFGGVGGPVLSLIALVALLATIRLQVRALKISERELALSRRELKLTRDELARTAEAQEAARQALDQQTLLMAASARAASTSALIAAFASERGIGGHDSPEAKKKIDELRRQLEEQRDGLE